MRPGPMSPLQFVRFVRRTHSGKDFATLARALTAHIPLLRMALDAGLFDWTDTPFKTLLHDLVPENLEYGVYVALCEAGAPILHWYSGTDVILRFATHARLNGLGVLTRDTIQQTFKLLCHHTKEDQKFLMMRMFSEIHHGLCDGTVWASHVMFDLCVAAKIFEWKKPSLQFVFTAATRALEPGCVAPWIEALPDDVSGSLKARMWSVIM